MFRTHPDAPRVLIANSNLVPKWATWEHFDALDRQGLMMYGQMTAGSWIYIGSQGIVQGTYETFVEMGRQHYGGSLAGRSPDTSVLSKRTETSHQKISNVALPRMCSGRGPDSSPSTVTLNRFCEWYFSWTAA